MNIDIVNKLLVILLPVLFVQYVKSMVNLTNPPLKDTFKSCQQNFQHSGHILAVAEPAERKEKKVEG